MHPLILFLLLASSCCVFGKDNVRALTEALGQEVIEIGTPIKELPADIEEEPSIENEEDEHSTTSTVSTRPPTTKRETRKTSTLHVSVATLHPKKLPKLLETSEDEEERIEKELAEIYKDNIDYKESSESTVKAVSKLTTTQATTRNTTNSTDDDSKPMARANDRDNFKFQPDPFNKAEIERFRTSVDDISCMKKLRQEGKSTTDAGCTTTLNVLVTISCLLLKILF